jgi:hypothetical protein
MQRVIRGGLAALLLFSLPSGALADKKDKKKGKGHDDDDDQGHVAVSVDVAFKLEERHAAETYFVEKHGRGNCPPGLAKKNNGCLPPGQAKQRYVVGQPLPREVVIVEPPPELVVRIGPPPSGYRYALVDGDLVKLAVGTALVVDAIHGLVH